MGRKSHANEHGAQGTLAKRRKELVEADLQETLRDSQVHEAMRLARTYLPTDVKILHEMIQDEDIPATARVAAVKAMHEIGYPKNAGRAVGGGGVPGKVVFNIVDFSGGATRVEALAMPVKSLPDVSDAELDP